MGFSRDTFYRYQTARNSGAVEALLEASRRKPNLKNRVDETTEQAVVEFATAFLALASQSQQRAAKEGHLRVSVRRPSHLVAPQPFVHEAAVG